MKLEPSSKRSKTVAPRVVIDNVLVIICAITKYSGDDKNRWR